MGNIHWRALAVGSLLYLLQPLPVATAAEEDPFLDWLTAEEIDNNCRKLLFVERREISRTVQEAAALGSQGRQLAESQLPDADHHARLADMQQRAESAAEHLGCQGEGGKHLEVARMRANRIITQNLLLAVHSASSEEEFKLEMMPHEYEAARIYDAYLHRLLGSEYQQFAVDQREAAMTRVPEDADDFDFGYVADMVALMGTLETTIGELALEVAANDAALSIRPHYTSATEWIPALVTPATGDLVGSVWAAPSYFPVAGGRVAGYMLHAADGTLRLEALGVDAGLTADDVEARLLVQTSPAPAMRGAPSMSTPAGGN